MDEGIIKDVGALEVEAEHLKEGQDELKSTTAVLETRQKWNDESIDKFFRQLNELTDRVALLEGDTAPVETAPTETVPEETAPTETVIETMEKEAPKKERKYIFGII